jgi:hypothetical protein
LTARPDGSRSRRLRPFRPAASAKSTPTAPFLPSRDGLGFSNSWPSEPAISLRTPLGRMGVGNAARGLCGGMIFAALDYWHAGLPPPASRPGPGDPLFGFIVRRLLTSWHLPGGVLRYYRWMRLPTADAAHRSVSWSWPKVRASIDAGQPAALGVVTVASANPLLLGRNHQVIACGYQVSGTAVRLQVYDPNTGPDDQVFIQFDTAALAAPGFENNLSIGWPVRGFFVTAYSPVRPPAAG